MRRGKRNQKQDFKQRKDLLAALMASEGVQIQIDPNAHTAYATELKNGSKLIVLPDYSFDDENVYDHFQAHEVAHVIHSPMTDVHDILHDKDRPGFHPFINITEDARIEKLIKEQFPGLGKIFTASYKKLIEDGWFGKDIESREDLGLIDRINIHMKAGFSIPQRFEDGAEKDFVKRVEESRTFEEALAVARDIYDYMKEQQAEMPPMPDLKDNPGEGDGTSDEQEGNEGTKFTDGGTDDTEASGEGDEESTGEDTEGDDGRGESDGEDTEDESDSNESDASGSSTGPGSGMETEESETDDTPISETDNNFREKEKELQEQTKSQTGFSWSWTIPTLDLNTDVTSWKDAYKTASTGMTAMKLGGADTLGLFDDDYISDFDNDLDEDEEAAEERAVDNYFSN